MLCVCVLWARALHNFSRPRSSYHSRDPLDGTSQEAFNLRTLKRRQKQLKYLKKHHECVMVVVVVAPASCVWVLCKLLLLTQNATRNTETICRNLNGL